MKKSKILLIVFTLLIATIALVSCQNKNETKITVNAQSDESVLALSFLSSSTILSNDNQLNLSGNGNHHHNNKNEDCEQTEEIDMDKVNSYLQMMESFLVNDGVINTQTLESDMEEYEFKMIFSVKNLTYTTSEYVLYFNQTLLQDDDDLDDDDDDMKLSQRKHHKEGRKPKFDDDTEYLLEGIAVIGDITYELIGVKEEEDSEIELKVSVKLDESNYVILEQEIEDDEISYQYELIKNGKKSLSIEFEIEDSEEFEIEIKQIEDGKVVYYNFEKDTVDNVIKIKYRNNGDVFNLVAKGYIDEETNEVVYEYKVCESSKLYHYHKHCK